MLRTQPSIIRQTLVIAFGVSLLTVSLTGNGSPQPEGPGMPAPGAASPNFQRRDSVLEIIRAFTGKKTRPALAALFSGTDPSFTQNPSVVLSDGNASAQITLMLFGRAGEFPRFAITGGHCTNARMVQNGVWILDITPKKGSIATSVTVLSGGSLTEYPLTVAPPLAIFDAKKADAALRDYVTIANDLAAQRRPGPR